MEKKVSKPVYIQRKTPVIEIGSGTFVVNITPRQEQAFARTKNFTKGLSEMRLRRRNAVPEQIKKSTG